MMTSLVYAYLFVCVCLCVFRLEKVNKLTPVCASTISCKHRGVDRILSILPYVVGAVARQNVEELIRPCAFYLAL